VAKDIATDLHYRELAQNQPATELGCQDAEEATTAVSESIPFRKRLWNLPCCCKLISPKRAAYLDNASLILTCVERLYKVHWFWSECSLVLDQKGQNEPVGCPRLFSGYQAIFQI